MTPTYNQITDWNLGPLNDIASSVRKIQRSLEAEASRTAQPVMRLTEKQWKGLSRNAADERARKELGWLLNLADSFGDVATVLEDASHGIRGAIDALTSAKNAAAADGYWLNTDDSSFGVRYMSSWSGNDDDAQTEFEWVTRLRGLGQAADTAVGLASTAVTAALATVSTLAPDSMNIAHTRVDSSKAVEDARAIQDGTATPEQRARFIAAMHLSPADLTALARGERIQIAPEKLQYIWRAVGAIDVGNPNIHGMAAFDRFATGPGQERERAGLANGLRVLSSGRVTSRRGEGDGSLLPTSIKDTLDHGFGATPGTPEAQDLATLQRLLGSGDAGYSVGPRNNRSADIDAELYSDTRTGSDPLQMRPYAPDLSPDAPRIFAPSTFSVAPGTGSGAAAAVPGTYDQSEPARSVIAGLREGELRLSPPKAPVTHTV